MTEGGPDLYKERSGCVERNGKITDMKREVLDFLICPACLPDENPLRLKYADILGEEVMGGVLECGHCKGAYPIRNGIAGLIPAGSEGAAGPSLRYEGPDLLSAYLWSQYSDIFGDPEANRAYEAVG